MDYVIVCAPAGTGLKGAVAKFKNAFGVNNVAHRDVEAILCSSTEAEDALSHVEIFKPSNHQDWPKMKEITWHLPRDRVITLWHAALRNALNELQNSNADSNEDVKLLSCHLTLYCGRRNEFYSPFNVNLFVEKEGEVIISKPSHLLLLIDDIYDMYLRLTDKDQLFDTQERKDRYLERIWDEVEDKKGPQNFPPNLHSSLILEWKLCVLTNLLSWRHSEILMAENLARQLDAKFLLWGVKQPTKIAAAWLRKSYSTLYFSHPISRPRRQKIEAGSWPPIVSQFNELQDKLFERNLVGVMPTAIDEYRIARNREEGTFLKRRFPVLGERWPLPAKNIDSLLYSTPKNSADMHHKDLLTNEDTDSASEVADREDVSTQLRALESQIMFQIASRDHLLVSSTNGLLVFRPFYLKGGFSGGVKAEIEHWTILTRSEPNEPNRRAEKREKEEGIGPNRQAAFIHFDDDFFSFLDFAKREDSNVFLNQSVDAKIPRIMGVKFGLGEHIAPEVYKAIKSGNLTSALDKGIVPDLSKIKRALPEIKKEAKITVLRENLTGTQASSSKVGIWIVKDEKELGRYYEEIANFLKTKYLFSLEPDYKQYLKDDNVDDKLKREFADNKESLSSKAKLSKIDEKYWEIVDDKKRYGIEDTNTQLNIYETKTPLPSIWKERAIDLWNKAEENPS